MASSSLRREPRELDNNNSIVASFRMSLAQFILANLEAILAEWERYAKTIPVASDMDTSALRDHASSILTAIARDMERVQSPADQEAKSKGHAVRVQGGVDTAAETHASNRLRASFDLNEVVSEYRALRASVIRLWTRQISAVDGDAIYDLTRFNEGIDQALTESISRYTALHDRSRELFLGVLGHDLRTPIGVVLTSAKFLLESQGPGSSQSKAAALILSSGTRIKQMVSDLLDVAHTRLEGSLAIEPQRIDLAVTCQQVVEEMQVLYPQRTLSLRMSGELLTTADASRIGQLLSNLLQNAIQHGAEGAPITMSARGEHDRIVLTVHNEGVPISEAARKRIFEPLDRGEKRSATRSSSNLGLGLYIAREIATAHSGSIDVKSSREEGTSFIVYLPRR